MSMKLEESEAKVNEIVKQRMKDLHNKGQYDLSQSPEEYEKILVKLEAEVRNHISVQQQMKLYIESYQSKVEELEPIEEKAKDMQVQIEEFKKQKEQMKQEFEDIKNTLKEKAELWEKERSSLKRQIVEKERE